MKIQLLIVDDEEEIRDALSRHFRYLGYAVEVAEDGEAALGKMQELRVDIVISDIRMPKMDGVMLLERIRHEHPTTRVIMMTGQVAQAAVLACMQEGAETCVFKPFEDMTELESAVSTSVATVKRWWKILAELRNLDGSGETSAHG